MLKEYKTDFHIHTVLSACAEIEMIPPLIIQQAKMLDLSILAITDHNSCGNISAVMDAAKDSGMVILPGMELQTKEEIHLLCLFENLDLTLQWEKEIWEKLPQIENAEEIYGPQYFVDMTGNYLRSESQMLAAAADISLEQAIQRIQKIGGLAIPAHVDRDRNSIYRNIGYFPEELNPNGWEVTSRFKQSECYRKYPELLERKLIVDGDAHQLDQINNMTRFYLHEPSFAEIKLAFQGTTDRKIIIHWPSEDSL